MTTKTKEEYLKWFEDENTVNPYNEGLGFFDFGKIAYIAGHKASEDIIQQQKEEIAELKDRLEQSVDMSVIIELNKEIEKKAKIISLLKQSNEFYASEVYASDADNSPNYHDCLPFEDMENLDGYVMGGKLAREVKQQVKEIENEN